MLKSSGANANPELERLDGGEEDRIVPRRKRRAKIARYHQLCVRAQNIAERASGVCKLYDSPDAGISACKTRKGRY